MGRAVYITARSDVITVLLMRFIMLRFKNLKKNKGEMYIDTLISIFIISLFITIVIVVTSVFVKIYHMNQFADKISDYIAVAGGTAGIDIEELAEEMNVEMDRYEIIVADDAICLPDQDNPEKIQLTCQYTVNVYSTVYIGLGGIVDSIPISISSSAKGRSEVYWKELESVTL